MVTKWGMSDLIGPVYLGGEEEVFIGRDYGRAKDISDDFANEVDSEVKRIIKESYDKAEGIIRFNKDKLCEISDILIAEEKIEGERFKTLISDDMLRHEALIAAHRLISDEARSAALVTEEKKEEETVSQEE